MNNRIKDTFDSIHAEAELKESTRAFLAQKYRRRPFPRLAAAAACLLFILLGSNWLYFTPTAQISIDINPSIELGINRFDKVVTVTGCNDDGAVLVESLDIRHLSYTEAIDQILENETIVALLSGDEILSIGVIGPDGQQSTQILTDIATCTAQTENTYCYHAHAEEVEAAHGMGLSCGKYRAFLELQALDPDITAEEIQDMTMRQIRDMIAALDPSGESHQGGGHHGHGHGK